MSITVALLKSKLYLDLTTSEFDTAIQQLIDDIVYDAIEYMDNDDITNASELTRNIERKLCLQIAYEFKRRKDHGLESVSFPDGSLQKSRSGRWLKDVSEVLNFYSRINL